MDSIDLYDTILGMDVNDIDLKLVKVLMEIIVETDNPAIRDNCALKIADVQENGIVPNIDITPIIQTIQRLKDSRHLSTLVYCCSEFDCTTYLFFFVELFVLKNDQIFIDVLSVIEAMKGPLKRNEKIKSLNLLSHYRNSIAKTNPKLPYVNYITEFIQSIEGI